MLLPLNVKKSAQNLLFFGTNNAGDIDLRTNTGDVPAMLVSQKDHFDVYELIIGQDSAHEHFISFMKMYTTRLTRHYGRGEKEYRQKIQFCNGTQKKFFEFAIVY
jgi:hypothetical protein